MKICVRCEQLNEDTAPHCSSCRHGELVPANPMPQPPPQPRPRKPSPEYLTAEREGKLTVLKCRTPGEAFLVAEQLEAADILVMLPDDEALAQEFETHGHVSLRISAQSYAAAQELQNIIERKHWEDRSHAPLSRPMIGVALLLGFLVMPGAFGLFMINDVYKAKGYERKARTFPRWFWLGVGLLIFVIIILSNRRGH